MSKFKVEVGVPVLGRTRETTYPFFEMKPGDSFLVPFDEGDRTRARRRASNAAAMFCKNHPERRLRRVCRTVDGGFRVWLIADVDAPDPA